jgi:WD40 repeat protein
MLSSIIKIHAHVYNAYLKTCSVGDWRYQHGRSYALHQIGNGDEHLGAVSALCWMGKEDGVLASGCSDSYLRIWDVTSRKMITRLDAQEDEVQCLAAHKWAPSVVLSGGADCNVRVHDARNARSCVGILKGAESDVEVNQLTLSCLFSSYNVHLIHLHIWHSSK